MSEKKCPQCGINDLQGDQKICDTCNEILKQEHDALSAAHQRTVDDDFRRHTGQEPRNYKYDLI